MKQGFITSHTKRNESQVLVHRSYSLTNAIRALLGQTSLTGLEREMDQECDRIYGPKTGGDSVRVPTGMLVSRDMTSAGVSGSNYLVGTNNMGGNFIDMLRPRSLAAKLGCTMMPGLRGNVTIPKQTAPGVAYWIPNEGAAITESQPTIGQLALTPKTAGIYVEVSRQLMLQSNPSVDQLLMADMAKSMATEMDRVILNGSGSSGEPMGILNTSGIGSVVGTSLGLAGLLEFQSDVAANNGDLANASYVTTPAVAAALAQRQRFASTDSPLWQGNTMEGTVFGSRAVSTTLMPAGTMLFGDFSEVIVGEWGVLELATTDSHASNFLSGIVGIRAFLTIDVGVRQAGAFSKAVSIT